MSIGGKQHLYYAQLHEKYGDAVRIGPSYNPSLMSGLFGHSPHSYPGPNEIVIRDVNAVAPILGNNGLPKGPCKFHDLSRLVKYTPKCSLSLGWEITRKAGCETLDRYSRQDGAHQKEAAVDQGIQYSGPQRL